MVLPLHLVTFRCQDREKSDNGWGWSLRGMVIPLWWALQYQELVQFGFCKVKILASLVMVVCGKGKERVNIPVVTVKNGHSLAGQALNLEHRVGGGGYI